MPQWRVRLLLLLVGLVFGLRPAAMRADSITLTPAGQAAGFSLITFAYNFPDASASGPFGIAFSGSDVLVSDYPSDSILAFPSDANGQDASLAAAVRNYSQPLGIAKLGDNFYLAEKSPGEIVEINSNGTFDHSIVNLPDATGIAADPFTGKLFVSNVSSGIYVVDPVLKTAALFTSGIFDGLTLSPDGKTLYAAEYGVGIQGFETATGKQVFSSASIPGVDGIALGFGTLSGEIFGNTNYGQVVEVNLLTGVQTLIGTGGSRGDFVTVDANNGSLLVTQSDSVLRLIPSGGGSFSPSAVPEPSTWILLCSGLLVVALYRRRLVHS